jgi:hypothetical protein
LEVSVGAVSAVSAEDRAVAAGPAADSNEVT